MREKNLSIYQTISFLLMVVFVFSPLAIKKAAAQSVRSYGGLGTGMAISSLPQCKGLIDSSMAGLFSGIGSLFSNSSTLGDATQGGIGNVSATVDGAAAMSEQFYEEALNDPAIKETMARTLKTELDAAMNEFDKEKTKVYDEESARRLQIIADNIAAMRNDMSALRNNDSCLDSIGKMMAKMALQKITMSTIDWINHGFEGSPAFVQNRTTFWRDIAKNELLEFGFEIRDISPYSKDWLKNQAAAFNNKFTNNARYSLDELIDRTSPGITAADFRADFSKGGWSAWSYLTQVPGNNPLGFNLLASNELEARLAGTSQSRAQDIRDNLMMAGGFLGDERCVDPISGKPTGVTRAEHNAALRDTPPQYLCPSNQWEYVTPGKMIAEAATNAVNYPNNQLLNVDDLNSSVAAISDAIIAHFSNKLMTDGFANLGNEGYSGALSYTNSSISYDTKTEEDFLRSHINSSSWLQNNPEFNIRTDLTQALIDEQRTYIDKLKLQNKELNSTTDGKPYNVNAYSYALPDGGSAVVSNAYGLMPAIYQLDYCIPGPHPGWENDSKITLASRFNSINPAEEQPQNLAGEIANGAVGVGLNAVPYVGPVLSSLFGILTGDDAAKRLSTDTRCYYTRQFYAMTGFSFQCRYGNTIDQVDANMSTQDGLFGVMNSVLDRYIKIMRQTYFSSPELLPEVAEEGKKYFNHLSGYNKMLKDNEEKIISLEAKIKSLQEIKDNVDRLNNELRERKIRDRRTGQILATDAQQKEQYEDYIRDEINAFGRISEEMVTGNDIATADRIAKEIIGEKEYVYKTLLKGKYGCEADVEKITKNFPATPGGATQPDYNWNKFNIHSVQRMTYPFPIIYDYNKLSAGSDIPDPWKGGNEGLAKMPANEYAKYGPGFLSFVYFATDYASDNRDFYDGHERLSLGGLVYDHDSGGDGGQHVYDWVSIGEARAPVGTSPALDGRGLFEKTIGIY